MTATPNPIPWRMTTQQYQAFPVSDRGVRMVGWNRTGPNVVMRNRETVEVEFVDHAAADVEGDDGQWYRAPVTAADAFDRYCADVDVELLRRTGSDAESLGIDIAQVERAHGDHLTAKALADWWIDKYNLGDRTP